MFDGRFDGLTPFALMRGGAGKLFQFVVAAVMWMSVGLVSPTMAQSTVIVRNDPGGDLIARVNMLEELRRTGQRIEIRPGYCRSACTLYLGLPNTCTYRNVRFGFHGPTSNTRGIGLLPSEFDRWSRVMASYYPAQLQGWFMETGRNVPDGYIFITGAEMIRLGVPEC